MMLTVQLSALAYSSYGLLSSWKYGDGGAIPVRSSYIMDALA